MEFEKGTCWVETVRLSKKEQAEIGNRTKVGNNKDIIRTNPRLAQNRKRKDIVLLVGTQKLTRMIIDILYTKHQSVSGNA